MNLKQYRVLALDDDSVVLKVLQVGLKGIELDTCGRIEEARQLLAHNSYDLAILDKNLPDGTSLDLAREILDGKADTDVIMMSAFADVSSAVLSVQYGVSDYIVKPFDLDDVIARVARVRENQSLRRHNAELITKLERSNEALKDLTTRDPLTKLFNHAHFQSALEAEVQRSQRHDLRFSIAVIDVDHFKEINDSRGHPVGDAVLKLIADTLRGETAIPFSLRRQDMAARYGGDEFTLLLPQTSRTGAAVKAESLRTLMTSGKREPVDAPSFTISCGVACYPEDGDSRVALLRSADAALFAAKGAGRNLVVAYSPEIVGPSGNRPAQVTRETVACLEEALDRESFQFDYQPVVEVETWTPFAYEALCRPTQGFERIADLLAVAERAGRVRSLGRIVRQRCIEPIDQLPDGCSLFINLHPQELHDPQLLELEDTLAEHAGRIVFELTETAEISNYRRAREIIGELRQSGFRLALDDLGSGYSGLNALAELKPDIVKIDLTLVRSTQRDRSTRRLVKHLLEFAQGEGMLVVAEGVETRQELEIVTELGIPMVQGFLLGRPAPPFAAPIVPEL